MHKAAIIVVTKIIKNVLNFVSLLILGVVIFGIGFMVWIR